MKYLKALTEGRSRRLVAVASGIVGLLAIVAVGGRVQWLKHHAAKPAPKVAAVSPEPPTSPYPDPPGILLHHSDTPESMHGVKFDAKVLDRIAKQRGFSITWEGKTYHISYHYVILPDGTVQAGRPEHCPGAHCPKFNNWIGICLIGDFHQHRHWWPSEPTSAQKTALVTLCESLMSKYRIPPENVKRHRDVHGTWCPGNRFPFAEIVSQLNTYAVAHPEVRSRPATALASAAGATPKRGLPSRSGRRTE